MKLRPAAAALALALTVGVLPAPAADASNAANTSIASDPSNAEQQAVDRSVAAASAQGIGQSIAVVDRSTGELVAGRGGDVQYISESIVKLFTLAYYQVQAGGQPDGSLTRTLRTMIIGSDDGIESSLWNTDIVPAMAARYGLRHTANGPRTGPGDWGWELITADDEAQFLFEAAADPEVGPLLLDAMANTAPTAADGSDQDFGLNALTGDHGSKQGWTDIGSTDQVQIHSVGWTDRYYVAILQTAADPDIDAMRAAATDAARAVQAAEEPAGDPAPEPAQDPQTPTQDAAAADPLAAAFAELRTEIGTILGRLTGADPV